jgi:hypothetical protein
MRQPRGGGARTLAPDPGLCSATPLGLGAARTALPGHITCAHHLRSDLRIIRALLRHKVAEFVLIADAGLLSQPTLQRLPCHFHDFIVELLAEGGFAVEFEAVKPGQDSFDAGEAGSRHPKLCKTVHFDQELLQKLLENLIGDHCWVAIPLRTGATPAPEVIDLEAFQRKLNIRRNVFPIRRRASEQQGPGPRIRPASRCWGTCPPTGSTESCTWRVPQWDGPRSKCRGRTRRNARPC